MAEDLTEVSNSDLEGRISRTRALDPNRQRLLDERERRKADGVSKTEALIEDRHQETIDRADSSLCRSNLSLALSVVAILVAAAIPTIQYLLPPRESQSTKLDSQSSPQHPASHSDLPFDEPPHPRPEGSPLSTQSPKGSQQPAAAPPTSEHQPPKTEN